MKIIKNKKDDENNKKISNMELVIKYLKEELNKKIKD